MSTRHSKPRITKYELAALLAERANEIADGQPITIRNPGTSNPSQIALLEYKAGVSPKKLTRTWPNGDVDIWFISELKK